ncbi:HAD family phosphatase [Tamlana fucoidanivorans]|uniref:HAD family phosphatase n=1 Tax=Allotamlana fucoidanivorans TaxID=2583814 RepID=A0A5C4SIC7_9FLAO|nr:HAD family hydrolase [Tamlana fucoidanivorans]TNJ43426.1 HAD family phosphatase [Tamlana fucoidanivorans]
MDFSKVKLVVSDMDGTLLNQNNEVSYRFFSQFKALKKRNIHFVAASGRQYQSIVDKLDIIKNDITIIGENGGVLQHEQETKVLLQLSKSEVAKTVELLRTISHCYVVLCGRKAAYIETNDAHFISKFKQYYVAYEVIDDLLQDIDDEFLKIAVYHFESSEDFVLPHIQSLNKSFQVIVSGQHWLDISHINANKAYALQMVQEKMNIATHETMIFGDYNNDLEMMRLGYFSYAMGNAHPKVKEAARFETKTNSEEGVEYILEKLIAS